MDAIKDVRIISTVAPITGVTPPDDILTVAPATTPASPVFNARPPVLSDAASAVILQEQTRSRAPTKSELTKSSGNEPANNAAAAAKVSQASRRVTQGYAGSKTPASDPANIGDTMAALLVKSMGTPKKTPDFPRSMPIISTLAN